MKLKHIVEAQQFSRKWLENELFPLAEAMEKIVDHGGSDILTGKRLVSLFYEESTRTRASFEIAIDYLGGRVVFSTVSGRDFSAAKGESLEHTIKTLNRYHPDVIVLRHYQEGSAKIAAGISDASIINAGDGSGQHPTQALLDVFTIQKKLGRIDGISIAMIGDLLNGRTVHSLAYLLAKFSDVKMYFVSPKQARMREDIKEHLRKHHVWFKEESDLRPIAPLVDVGYQTRTQKKRGTKIDRSDPDQGFLIIDGEVADSMKEDAIIMHPLPIDDKDKEIRPEVEKNHRAVYLTDQLDSGLSARMALLKILLS